MRPLVLIMVKMSGYGKTIKVEDKINKLVSFHIDDEKLLEKYYYLQYYYQKSITKSITIYIKIEDLKNIRLDALPVYDGRYIKTKIRTFDDKLYKNFRGLDMPEDDIECESFTVSFIDSLLVYDKKYYLQVYLDNCVYKIVSKQVTDYLDENIFED